MSLTCRSRGQRTLKKTKGVHYSIENRRAKHMLRGIPRADEEGAVRNASQASVVK